ncbi:hypothetical protein [Dysgonomonas macrotermitis]|uniref:Uncharacterized protein n=1 Tax=Dysgonomonas macrotermitis TaxID=1346286 RepID=A0A1M4Y4L1_9BACT|nr:hypothetical protein [Dysgonomonas macrotermitis]SHF00744.1 hypothetical protein SAMN05444362_10373 [Dysgonomonas macrotermitis]
MDAFKRQIWEKDNLNLEYSSLNNLQTQHILYKIEKLCNISVDSINDATIFIKICKRLNKEYILLNINEKDGFSDLCSLLKLDMRQTSTVYVVWNYNEIDKFRASVLHYYWNYIWYGASDEMCLLYFSDIEVLVMITDYGNILVM